MKKTSRALTGDSSIIDLMEDATAMTRRARGPGEYACLQTLERQEGACAEMSEPGELDAADGLL